jgi:hypothetical protein
LANVVHFALLRMSGRLLTLPFPGLLIVMILTAACGSTSETTLNPTSPSSTRCQPTLGSPGASYGPSGGTGTLTVAVERECDWSASPNAPWIVLTAGKQGQGEGTVTYRVTENVDPVARRGSITVSSQSVQIAQDAAACHFTVAPAQLNAPAAGSDFAIEVRTHAACSWTAAVNASWATLAPASGKGDGAIQVHVVANTGETRTSEVIVAGERVLLTQEARSQTPAPPPPSPGPGPSPPEPPAPSPPQCSYDLSTNSASFDGEGGTGAVRVRTASGCPWSVVSSAAWVTVLGVPSGTGEAEIRYLVVANSSSSGRSATLTIQSQVLRISQARGEELKFEGKISSLSGSCPNLRFRLDNLTVATDTGTEFRRGDCSKARNGSDVTVRGFRQPDGSVLATRVEFD